MFPTILSLFGMFFLVNGAALQNIADKNAIIGVPGDGKLLAIKAYPAIANYQSDLYEVYHEPYYFVSRIIYYFLIFLFKFILFII